jgi:hypothetical protein
MTDRDGMYVHVTAKGAMSFRMNCQLDVLAAIDDAALKARRNGHPISTAFRFGPEQKIPSGTHCVTR